MAHLDSRISTTLGITLICLLCTVLVLLAETLTEIILLYMQIVPSLSEGEGTGTKECLLSLELTADFV